MNTFIFDFDGTLVDSMPVFVGASLKLLDSHGIKYGEDIVKIITPLGLQGQAKYYREELGLDMTMEEIRDTVGAEIHYAYLNTIPAKNNVISVLKALKERGANLNVLTASPHETLDPCLKRIGIYDIFTNVWSCEDFDTTKSDPNIYHRAAAIIGEKVEDIVFLDDNYNADKTAKEAGMKVCGVYDDSSKDDIEEIKSVSDWYIYDFSELLEIDELK